MNTDLAHALVDRIYATASEPERWQDFVDELSVALGGPAIILVLQLPGFAVPVWSFRAHLRPMPSQVLAEACRNQLPLISGASRAIQTGFTPMNELLSVEDLAGSDFCAEWLEPQGLLPLGGVGYCFASANGKPMAEIMIFERRGCRALGPADRALCDVLAPHLACAYRLHRRMGGEQHERVALAGVMDRLPIGLVLLDRELRPVVTNRTADRILALDDGFSLGPDGLRAMNVRDDTVMQEILSEFIAGKRSAADGESLMAVSRPSGKRAFPLLIGMLDDAAAGDVAEDAIISLIFGDPETGQGITPTAIGSAYDLTPAESELVGLLAEGYCLAEAAEKRGVSVNTVRTQLKHVFAKTDTNRQGDLIRLVLTGSASFPRSGA
ncbi:MAG: helix-turn-helix transcriptional regulator [Deltaproteobacteria bacterium]|nr:helix-turn-helix transcriptional regulator [Deltaproteobacteria bacterium]MBW2399513.1 helix-turn-helix transcriptional regulator [Deltaproteobacteria bacterium]MBW2666890.1 helix-turn-helix transcriptional regulator [Deltaproteobacteria bacterium]